jgi:hypothetical protein
MSEKLLRFFLLSEVATVRLKCRRPGCGAITEVQIGRLKDRFPEGCCKVCNAPFDVIDKSDTTRYGTNWLSMLAECAAALGKDSVYVDVEFVLSAESPCRLDRTPETDQKRPDQ